MDETAKKVTLLPDSESSELQAGVSDFFGYAPLTSNVTYTPNQFFDVCLPNCSGPCVKLVGYMIRRHFGWVDEYGKPQEEQLVISYKDLIDNAGVPRGHIREALDEALNRKFINCVRKPRPAQRGKSPITGLYELRFSDNPDYVKDPERFDGFFDGEGNFTYTPNQFFDVCLRQETFSVTKAVGTVIRFSIGFKVRRGGGRRQFAKVALTFISDYANMTRKTACSALRKAVEGRHLIQFEEGVFSHQKSAQVTASYGLNWADKSPIDYALGAIGTKATPKLPQSDNEGGYPENTPEELPRNYPRSYPENTPEELPRNYSKERKPTNKTCKQQQAASGLAAADIELVSLLQEKGFSERDAQRLTLNHSADVVRRQVEWLPMRNPGMNPVGLLRKAIEEDWSQPATENVRALTLSHGRTFAAYFYAGIAGHDGDPIADPSSTAVDLAERFVKRLLQIWDAQDQIPEWARDFGKHIAVEMQSKKGVVPTLSFVLNSSPYGEQFYKSFVTKRAQALREEIERRREAHHARYWKEYLQYLNAEYRRRAEHEPDAIQAFHVWRDEQKAQIQSWRHLGGEARERYLQQHESPKAKKQHFAEYFGYDFWTWDQEVNPETFSEGGKAA